VTGVITSKEYQKTSNNYKFKIITSDKQKLFFYSQQKYQGINQELGVNEKYLFCLSKGKKYWFLENWEKIGETIKEIPEWLNKRKEELATFNLKNLQEQAGIKKFEQLEKKLNYLKEQVNKTSSEEEVFLEYLEQFIDLLLIKHLSIKTNQGQQLTEKEEKERDILDKIVANWFYKTNQ
jgi:hypothetical protein